MITGPQPPKPKNYLAIASMGPSLKAHACEVTRICDIRLARCRCWVNRVNPLLQATKIMYEHNPMEEPTAKPRRCGAKTRSGTPCAKYAVTGKRRCRLHGGASSGPKTAEGRARIAAANTKHGRYKNWREKRAKEKFYPGEVKPIMREAELARLLEGK